MEKVHAIEQELYREIVQIKKERLVQVTRCTATQTIKSVYCGFQSRSGPERYAKFHDPIVIEPADCRQAAKTGRFQFNGKDYPFKTNIRRAVIVDLVGGLDNDGNCEVGLYEVNGVPLRNQMATAMYEIYVRQEWARANDLTGPIKLSEYLMGTITDRTLVDSGRAPTSGTTRRMHVTTRWSAYTGAGSRCSPSQRPPSRTAQPSWPDGIRTRSPAWS
jgi:hypothetical protein